MKHKVVIREEDAGQRADVFIATLYPEFARSTLSKLFDEHIKLDGNTIKNGYKLRTGNTLIIDLEPLHRKPPPIELPILFENENVTVIDKPAGVLTHSKGGLNYEATVASFIELKLSGFDPTNNRAGIVHRLDRATSGVIITAKNLETAKHLQKQFSYRKAKKTYLAVVSGLVEPPEAIVDAAIERNPAHPQTFHVGSQGRPAQTHYTVLYTHQNTSSLELKPATGRTHQLRVHMSYINHPILGDSIYGGTQTSRLMLHASELELTLPGGDRRTFKSALPEDMASYFKPEEFVNAH